MLLPWTFSSFICGFLCSPLPPNYFDQWKLFWKWYPLFKICFVHYFTRLTVVWCYIVSLRVLFKASHISNAGVRVFYFNGLVKVDLGFMPPHQGWPFCRKKDPRKENTQGFAGRGGLEMLTSPETWWHLWRSWKESPPNYIIFIKYQCNQPPSISKGEKKSQDTSRLRIWIPRREHGLSLVNICSQIKDVTTFLTTHGWAHRCTSVCAPSLSVSPGIRHTFQQQKLIRGSSANNNENIIHLGLLPNSTQETFEANFCGVAVRRVPFHKCIARHLAHYLSYSFLFLKLFTWDLSLF